MGLKSTSVLFDPVTTDPLSPAPGEAWFRSDENKLKYFDGAETIEVCKQVALINYDFEDNSALVNNRREWSIGNGSEGNANVVIPFDAELIAMTMSAETAGTSVSIEVMHNNGVSESVPFTGQNDSVTTFANPLTPAGTAIGLRTDVEVGAYVDVRVSLYYKVEVP